MDSVLTLPVRGYQLCLSILPNMEAKLKMNNCEPVVLINRLIKLSLSFNSIVQRVSLFL